MSDETLATPEKRWLRFHVAAWTLVCLVWLLLIWTWRDLHLAMTVDDTFYYLKTARNLARGGGSTFDGINPTNGYHPLWLAFVAMLFTGLPDDMVVLCRAVFTVQIVMIWAGGLLLARLREVGGPLVLWPLALVMVNPFTAKIVLCCQETALQFLLSAAVLSWWWSLRSSPHGPTRFQQVALPFLCALLALARLDSIFYCGLLLAMPLLVPGNEREASFRAGVIATAQAGAIFAVFMLPYLLFNHVKYEHLMPVSGAIKLQLERDEIAPPMARLAATFMAAGGLLGLWYFARKTGSKLLALLLPPAGAVCILAIYNFGVRGEMGPDLIRIWYLEPHLLVFALLGGYALDRHAGRRAARVILPGLAVAWLGITSLTWQYRLDPRSYNLYAAAARCSRWMEVEAPPNAVGAAWDAGFAGAFTSKPVMNLDGLISSWEFKEYLDRGTVDDFILRRHPVDYVIQYAWPKTLRAIAARFRTGPLPSAPQMATTVTGSHDPKAISSRWGVDLASFHVVHVECVMVSVAYDPKVTIGPVRYLVLSRTPVPSTPTLAEFALENAERSCESETLE